MAEGFQFSKNIRKRGRQVENAGARAVRRAARRVLKSLVYSTKVDKGVARSNWRVGIGAPTRAVIGAYYPYKKGSKGDGMGMSETANADAAISAGYEKIDTLRGLSGAGLKTSLYISNNISYLDKAMSGGTMTTAVLEAQSSLRSFKIFTNEGREEE